MTVGHTAADLFSHTLAARDRDPVCRIGSQPKDVLLPVGDRAEKGRVVAGHPVAARRPPRLIVDVRQARLRGADDEKVDVVPVTVDAPEDSSRRRRSEEHTSELQSRVDLVCRLLLEKKKQEIKELDLSTTPTG